MRVFLDTNIIVDVLTRRLPHFTDSKSVLDSCALHECEVFIAWHGLATAFYLLGTKIGEHSAQQALEGFLQNVSVATVGDSDARRSFALGFADLEDAMQAVAAEACLADCIITRNEGDFAKSSVAVLTPTMFLALYPSE